MLGGSGYRERNKQIRRRYYTDRLRHIHRQTKIDRYRQRYIDGQRHGER